MIQIANISATRRLARAVLAGKRYMDLVEKVMAEIPDEESPDWEQKALSTALSATSDPVLEAYDEWVRATQDVYRHCNVERMAQDPQL